MITFDAPNLDCMEPSELETLGPVLTILSDWANDSAYAIDHAETDKVASANMRKLCLQHYRRLPVWAQWRTAFPIPRYRPFDAPNLDTNDVKALRAVSKVFSELATYAGVKARAMRARASGRIPQALALEVLAEKTYQRLPDWARW